MGAGNGRRSCTAGMAVMLAVLVFAGTALYLTVDPESSSLFPKCPFLLLTGLECPGCGSQRAIHSLLNGDLPAAVHYNLLLVSSIPYLVSVAVLEVIWCILSRIRLSGRINESCIKAVSKMRETLCSGNAARIILAIIISFWIFRNFTPAF